MKDGETGVVGAHDLSNYTRTAVSFEDAMRRHRMIESIERAAGVVTD